MLQVQYDFEKEIKQKEGLTLHVPYIVKITFGHFYLHPAAGSSSNDDENNPFQDMEIDD